MVSITSISLLAPHRVSATIIATTAVLAELVTLCCQKINVFYLSDGIDSGTNRICGEGSDRTTNGRLISEADACRPKLLAIKPIKKGLCLYYE